MTTRRSLLAAALAPPAVADSVIWRAGSGGYHTYRIPSLLVTRSGALLAFCEGRRNSRSDTGDIDLLLRRSLDNGQTWTDSVIVAEHGGDTIGNPCPVVDRRTGVIWLLLTGNPGRMNKKDIVHSRDGSRNVWVTSSRDNGATWETPREITASVKRPEWTWYATGPGVGIQLSSGRMIIPCDHHEPFGSMEPYSHVIFSDDHGQSWKLGGTVAAQTHECQAVELSDGSILMNMRCQSWEEGFRSPFRRMVARSQDGGLTWKDVRIDDALKEPMCQASLIGIAGPRKSRVLVFANPADTKRVRMTIKVSRDEGRSWNVERTLHKGPSAYSCLAELPGRTIGCLYERGAESPYDEIALARFRLRG